MNEMSEGKELAEFLKSQGTAVSNIQMHKNIGSAMVFKVVTTEVSFCAMRYKEEYGDKKTEIFNHSDLLEATRLILDELANGIFPKSC